MKRGEPLQRTVGLARSPVRLRRQPLTRKARKPAERPEAPKAGDWTEETRAKLAARSEGVCEFCWTAPATDAHHRLRRRGGDHRIVNAAHLCRQDHRWLHEHPAQARETGFIVPTWSDPTTVPMLLGGSRWALLTTDGKYRTDPRGWPVA